MIQTTNNAAPTKQGMFLKHSFLSKQKYKKNHPKTRGVCETQMSLIMANSKDGQDHKDKYFYSCRKILSQEMIMCNMKDLILII